MLVTFSKSALPVGFLRSSRLLCAMPKGLIVRKLSSQISLKSANSVDKAKKIRKLSSTVDVDSNRREINEKVQELLDNNKRWASQKLEEDPGFFASRSEGQSPEYLWIGCSDSRVPAESLTGLKPGELFVHRNIANLVVNTDLNCLSVLTYAVEHLKVKHIIVCGHYGCGGVKAATAHDLDLGVIEHWLRNIRDVKRLHWPELSKVDDEQLRLNRLTELNVAEQCINLFKTGVVQQARLRSGFPKIHGLVYDIKDGLLKQIDVDLYGYLRKYQNVYKLYS
jgi:carbonic anhydrase